MPKEEDILQKIIQKFAFVQGCSKIPRERRIFIEVDYDNFNPVFLYAARELNFTHLCAITGLDEGERLSFIYNLAHDSGVMLNIKTSLPKEKPVLKTVIGYFSGAEIYERELADLLGVQVEGLPAGNRYPLTDEWPKEEFPLRKDWKPKG